MYFSIGWINLRQKDTHTRWWWWLRRRRNLCCWCSNAILVTIKLPSFASLVFANCFDAEKVEKGGKMEDGSDSICCEWVSWGSFMSLLLFLYPKITFFLFSFCRPFPLSLIGILACCWASQMNTDGQACVAETILTVNRLILPALPLITISISLSSCYCPFPSIHCKTIQGIRTNKRVYWRNLILWMMLNIGFITIYIHQRTNTFAR